MYGTNTWHTKQIISNPEIGATYKFIICFAANLGVGSYSIQTALVDSDTHLTANYEWQDHAYMFIVTNINKSQFEGSSWLEPKISIQELK